MEPVGICSTKSGVGATAPQRPQGQLTGKLKANELSSSGESFEPANRRPAPNDGYAPLSASASAVTCKQVATYSPQLGTLEGAGTYADLLARPVAPSQPIGPLNPTAMGSDYSELAVSLDPVNRRMSNDMSEPLSGKPDGTPSRSGGQHLFTSRRAS